jgi:hypothetical protein
MYVVDPVAKALIESGVDPALIEDSMSLAEDVERRISFQAWIQQYVDHGISSTINLPPWGSKSNNPNTVTQFGKTLLKYLPNVRGITAYPDGARGGQPITRVDYHEAIRLLDCGVFVDGGTSTAGSQSGSGQPMNEQQDAGAFAALADGGDGSMTEGGAATTEEIAGVQVGRLGSTCKEGICGE